LASDHSAKNRVNIKDAKNNFHKILLPNLWDPRLTDVTYELNSGMKL
jgi:hypothetical protein